MSNEELLTSLLSNVRETFFLKNRLATFKRWCYDKNGYICSSTKLAEAGFFCTSTRSEPSSAKCVFCDKEMIFDEDDDPWEEHVSHCPECPFVKMGKKDENEWLVDDLVELGCARAILDMKEAMQRDGDATKKQLEALVAFVKKS